jgi:hypothetical protein
MGPLQQIQDQIHLLTNDEDHRQELWLHYLKGNSIETFAKKLDQIKLEFSEDSDLRRKIHDLLSNPPASSFTEILDNFSDFERKTICLLLLGVDVKTISKIKGISEVRIRQVIHAIRYNSVWSKYDNILPNNGSK